MLRLRFFLDAGTGTCLWSGNDAARERYGYAIAVRDLPISGELRHMLDALCMRYDTSVDWDNPGGPSPWTTEESERFAVAVRSALERLRAALGEDHLVIDEWRDSHGADA
jgi:hypothetical protein